MFIRVVSYEVKPGMMDEAEQVYHKLTSEALRTQAGFQNGYAIINSRTGIAMTVAVWASKEDFEHFSATGAGKELADQVAPLLANPPTVTEFDRLIQA
jgi:quinol monooxygenase YgiN